MASAKAWYFAALGIVALSFGSSNGRCVFDKAANAVEQWKLAVHVRVAAGFERARRRRHLTRKCLLTLDIGLEDEPDDREKGSENQQGERH